MKYKFIKSLFLSLYSRIITSFLSQLWSPLTTVVEYYIFAKPRIRSYTNGVGLNISLHVFYIFYQNSPKIYLNKLIN